MERCTAESGTATDWDDPGSAAHHFASLVLRCAQDTLLKLTPMTPSPRRFAPGEGSRPSGRTCYLNTCAHARCRGSSLNRVRHSYSLVKQHMFLRSRGAFLRPGFACCGFAHPNEGWRSAEITLGCSGTRGACLNAARQTPCEAPCVSRRRSPLGAPPWRFWAPVPRFPHRQLSLACASASNRIGHSELLASGS